MTTLRTPIRITSLLVIALLGCGKEGPPIVPSRPGPVPIHDLAATCTDSGVALQWTLPSARLDGSRLRELAGYRVLLWTAGRGTEAGEVRFRDENLTMMEGRRIVWRGGWTPIDAAASYRVVTFTESGVESLPSNVVTVACPDDSFPETD